MKPTSPASSHMQADIRSGFTLVELLIVIVIIVVLASLSFFGFSRMRTMADKVASTRNLSQMQIANTSYAADHNGKYVPLSTADGDSIVTSKWFDNPDYLSELKGELAIKSNGKPDTSMPLSMLDPITVRSKGNQFKNIYASYGYISTGMPGGAYESPNSNIGYTMHQIQFPSRKAAFITATDWTARYESRFTWQGAAAVEGATSDQKIAYRHNGKALVVYYDGHVGEVSVADIEALDRQGGASNEFWNAGVGK